MFDVFYRFVFSTPGKPNVENEVSELADNMKSLRSMYTPSPVCPPPSDRTARSSVLHCAVTCTV